MAPLLRPLELAEYRLAPEDRLLERKVVLAEAVSWVPVLPDADVPGIYPIVSWKEWIFELAARRTRSCEEWLTGKGSDTTLLGGSPLASHAKR